MGKVSILYLVWNSMCRKADFVVNKKKKKRGFFLFQYFKKFLQLFLLSVQHFETKSVYEIVSNVLGIFIRNNSS